MQTQASSKPCKHFPIYLFLTIRLFRNCFSTHPPLNISLLGQCRAFITICIASIWYLTYVKDERFLCEQFGLLDNLCHPFRTHSILIMHIVFIKRVVIYSSPNILYNIAGNANMDKIYNVLVCNICAYVYI